MIAEFLLLLALSSRPSWCTPPIRVIQSRDTIAHYHHDKSISINSSFLKEEYRETIPHMIRHECVHYLQDARNIELPSSFGESPFVTDYAATSPSEDFAEVGATILSGKRVAGPKGRFVRGILRDLRQQTKPSSL